METDVNIWACIGLGLLGIVFFTFFKSRKHFIEWNPFKPRTVKVNDTWSFSVLLQENFGAWLWSFVMIVLVAVVVGYIPDVAEAISENLGLTVGTTSKSFFTLGIALSALVKK